MLEKVRCTEEMKVWLFDLAHGNLSDEKIVRGFIKHYVLYDMGTRDVKREILFNTLYGEHGTRIAMEGLDRALKNLIGEGERP